MAYLDDCRVLLGQGGGRPTLELFRRRRQDDLERTIQELERAKRHVVICEQGVKLAEARLADADRRRAELDPEEPSETPAP